ncbi:MAG: DUF4159 domain-containing protein [Rhizobiales bacterium]|nr:DUF4159 domain-containing protein [Hyphomicrobiales bacterium]MBI3673927.1 DUF4159 domain-containing protein [Hyphomicrobiales bacterium]
MFSSLTFATPWALAALLLLPAIWWLLRFTPPRPQTVRFAPLRLLLELVNREDQADRTPWWLMLLRLALAALVIIGVAHPSITPGQGTSLGNAPLLLVVDDGWAAAADWNRRRDILAEYIASARQAGAPVTLATTVPELRPHGLAAGDAEAAASRLAALAPQSLAPDRMALLAKLTPAFAASGTLHVVWMSDGIDDGHAADFAKGLEGLAGGKATVEAVIPAASRLPLVLAAPGLDGGRIKVTAWRAPLATASQAKIVARAGNGRSLGEADLLFAAGRGKAEALLDLPVELRNSIERLAIDGEQTAGAVWLTDDRWRRKTVAMQSGAAAEASQPLLSPLYYVSRALEPFAEISEPADANSLKQTLDAGLSMLVLADIGVLPQDQAEAVKAWVGRGGVLVRFAGPRLAGAEDPLVPVKLRQGGRSLGSVLSWETPQALQAFPDKRPFAGLAADPSVRVSRQVLAEPDADLPDRVWASLADGTPLVTAARAGKGLIVLFHVTANADWSNLPLSGLFVDMLRRVLDLAPAAGAGASAQAAATSMEDAGYAPWRALSGTGELAEPAPETRPIPAALIDKANPSPATPPGLYRKGEQNRALNAPTPGDGVKPIAGLDAAIALRDLEPSPSIPLAPYLFALAFLALLADGLAVLLLAGGLRRMGGGATAAMLALLLLLPSASPGRAEEALDFAMKAALDTRLAYVLTGDATIDRVSEEGLKGLGTVLKNRTSVEPGEPMAVDIERDELAFFPLLYWPVRADAAMPSDAALARMDSYMKNGGIIFFDLRNDGAGADALAGGVSAASDALRRMLAKLDIPPLETVPPEHVLTRSFYLMQSFPGRYDQGALWVERSDSQGGSSGNVDGVSAIIIGSNDYAASWAMDDNGEPLYAVIPGTDRQREMAYRAGINIVMYALTGNYKADQVHIPALLERLGQ